MKLILQKMLVYLTGVNLYITKYQQMYDAKPSRMLLIQLTDGNINYQAMEYRNIHQLNGEIPPGTKVVYIY